MPKSYQIIPEHNYPHQEVYVNDNSTLSAALPTDSGDTKLLCVFSSPKGIDRTMKTIQGFSEFIETFGFGPFSLYGQPYLNAYNAALSGAATLQCLRITAPNSYYATINIVAQYKLTTVGEGESAVTTMTVRFLAKAGTAINDLDNIDSAYTALTQPTTDGYTEVKLFSVAYVGRGVWGNNIKVRISSNATADKENSFKNYNLEIYENNNGLTMKETFPVVFSTEDATVNDANIFVDSVINEPSSGSKYIFIKTYTAGFVGVVNAYKTQFTSSILTINDFDIFLGVDKNTKSAISHYVIDTTSNTVGIISVSSLSGIGLLNGSDGSFSSGTAENTRATALDTAYQAAFDGTTDPYIASKNKFPLNIILDANYSVTVKILLATLAVSRKDCMVILDCGTGITTKSSIASYVSTNLDSYVLNRVQMIDAYVGKIKDPYSKKIVTVTGTYKLASAYPLHFQEHEGKHVPLAGNNFGKLTGFITNTVYPVFDEDVDSAAMDILADARVNFARLNANQELVRATQTTRQEESSNLSEANNVFILLDIKRDCEKLCTLYEYNFSEASDISRFNKDAETLLSKYKDAQLSSIEATFNKSDWEAARGILHLYISFVNKSLVKTTIIEIDVNR
jgi:hypothetical protein